MLSIIESEVNPSMVKCKKHFFDFPPELLNNKFLSAWINGYTNIPNQVVAAYMFKIIDIYQFIILIYLYGVRHFKTDHQTSRYQLADKLNFHKDTISKALKSLIFKKYISEKVVTGEKNNKYSIFQILIDAPSCRGVGLEDWEGVGLEDRGGVGLEDPIELSYRNKLRTNQQGKLLVGFFKTLKEEEKIKIYGPRQLSKKNMYSESSAYKTLLKQGHTPEDLLLMAIDLGSNGSYTGDKCHNPFSYLLKSDCSYYLNRAKGLLFKYDLIEQWVETGLLFNQLPESEKDLVRKNGGDSFRNYPKELRHKIYKKIKQETLNV
jgi:hypothetical protein